MSASAPKMYTATLNVTSHILEQASPNDCDDCAIAMAMRPLIDPGLFIKADFNCIRFYGRNSHHRKVDEVPTTDQIEAFIHAFDRCEIATEPRTFELPVRPEHKHLFRDGVLS